MDSCRVGFGGGGGWGGGWGGGGGVGELKKKKGKASFVDEN